MKIVSLLCILFLMTVSLVEARTKNEHESVIRTQLEETKHRNIDLRRRYDEAREDAIIFVALVGNSVPAEKRECVHEKLIGALDESLRRLNWNMLILEEAEKQQNWKSEYIEEGLVKVAMEQARVEKIFNIMKVFRKDMESGNFNKEILEDLGKAK